jgi:hypothetical protein
MFGRSRCCLLVVIAVVSLAPGLTGQTGSRQSARVANEWAPQVRPSSIPFADPRSERAPFIPGIREPGFAQLVRAAGMIFSAEVKKIERVPPAGEQSVETVAITLRVERALRGVTPGEDVTISQWIGLWAGGQRYRVGERVLLFLYPRSKLGLTSCVGGTLGRFNIDAWGRVMLSAQHFTAFAKDPVLGGRSLVPFSDFALAVRRR